MRLGVFGRSPGMALDSSGEMLVLANRAWTKLVTGVIFLLVFVFAAAVVEAGGVTLPSGTGLGSWLALGGVVVSLIAGISYKKRYVVDSERRELRLTRGIFWFSRTRRIPFEAVDSVSVATRLLGFPGQVWPRVAPNRELRVALKSGRTVILDVTTREGLMERWQSLIQSALDQANDSHPD